MHFLKKLNFWLSALLTATVLFMSSCSLAPQANYTALAEQERQEVTAWAAQEGAKQTTNVNELINSPELNALIEEALSSNPRIQQTVLTLKILRLQRYQARADRLTEVSLDDATENGEDDLNSHSGSLSISWEIDLWHKFAETESAAGMDEAADLRTTVACKDLLPSISLEAVLKDMSDSPQSLRLTDPV
jgi:outer membrane protein TolC